MKARRSSYNYEDPYSHTSQPDDFLIKLNIFTTNDPCQLQDISLIVTQLSQILGEYIAQQDAISNMYCDVVIFGGMTHMYDDDLPICETLF
jgi:hypothetical protein